MKISFIIPTLNRDDQCGQCIESIINSYELRKSSDIEIVVVFQGVNEVKNIKCKYSDLIKVYSIDKAGLSAARNYAVKNSSGDYLVFIDDDARVKEDFITVFEKLVNDVPSKAYCGRLYDPEKKEYFSDFFEKSESKYLGYIEFKQFKGSAHIFHRDVFDKVGLYDESFGAGAKYGGAEESDMFFRLKREKVSVYYCADLIFYHPKQLPANRVFDYSRSVSAMLTKQMLSDFKHSVIYAWLLLSDLTKYSLRSAQLFAFPEAIADKNNLFNYNMALKGSINGIYGYMAGSGKGK